jgi:hypothetical protein
LARCFTDQYVKEGDIRRDFEQWLRGRMRDSAESAALTADQ